MVTVVVILNLLIASLCLYVAWQMWHLRRVLVKATNALIAAEQSTHQVLSSAPRFVLKGQGGVARMRHQYRQAALQLQKAQQILALLGLGQFVWKRYGHVVSPSGSSRAQVARKSSRQSSKPLSKIF
jgi:hypothetical protein